MGSPASTLGFEGAAAVGRVSVSSPKLMKPFSKLNREIGYPDQIKPFNFLLTCHVKPLGHPPTVDPNRFQLITPYEPDSRLWLKKRWLEQYSGNEYRITTVGRQDARTALVKSYGDVLVEYEYHAEPKCADAHDEVCGKQTIGLLRRRHVRIDQLKYIGKESNSLEEVEAGLVHSSQNIYTEYSDPRRDEWQTKTIPALKSIPLTTLQQMSGLSRRTLIYSRNGKHRPHQKHQEKLKNILRKLRVI